MLSECRAVNFLAYLRRFTMASCDTSVYSPPRVSTLQSITQADYTRYEGMHLWQTMTGAARRPGHLLKRRLAAFLRPKCHPILLDTAINSRTTVRLNIYQVPNSCHGKNLQYDVPNGVPSLQCKSDR